MRKGELSARYQTPGWELDEDAIQQARRILRSRSTIARVLPLEYGALLPLRCATRTIGAIVLLPAAPLQRFPAAAARVLEGVTGQVALAIERALLEQQARETEILRKADELHRTLLNSVSHSLRGLRWRRF